jgi:hypothetical protein
MANRLLFILVALEQRALGIWWSRTAVQEQELPKHNNTYGVKLPQDCQVQDNGCAARLKHTVG